MNMMTQTKKDMFLSFFFYPSLIPTCLLRAPDILVGMHGIHGHLT